MKILDLLKMVPDVVEELEVAADGRSLDPGFLRMILNERDNHALEEALLLKERYGGTVQAVALDAAEGDDALFAALAKGADRAVKIVDGGVPLSTREAAYHMAQALGTVAGLMPADLILTGAQAIDDLDGLTAPLISQVLGLPYLGLVTSVATDGQRTLTAMKEFAGGVRGQYEVDLPAVLGIQAAEKPPRYVPVAKVRAAMKSQKIEVAAVPTMADGGSALLSVAALAKPEVSEKAEMLEGSTEQIVARVCEILAARGLL